MSKEDKNNIEEGMFLDPRPGLYDVIGEPVKTFIKGAYDKYKSSSEVKNGASPSNSSSRSSSSSSASASGSASGSGDDYTPPSKLRKAMYKIPKVGRKLKYDDVKKFRGHYNKRLKDVENAENASTQAKNEVNKAGHNYNLMKDYNKVYNGGKQGEVVKAKTELDRTTKNFKNKLNDVTTAKNRVSDIKQHRKTFLESFEQSYAELCDLLETINTTCTGMMGVLPNTAVKSVTCKSCKQHKGMHNYPYTKKRKVNKVDE